MSPATLAVDAGQTQTRVALAGSRDPRVATGPGVSRLEGRAAVAEIAAPVLRAIAELGDLPDGPAVGIGLSGIESLGEAELRRLALTVGRELGAPRVAIASDGVASHLGALGGGTGAVVAAGTGTVAIAHDGERWARVDGWGSLLGDAGSGFAIGRAGLDAALREHDGRGGSPALREAAVSRFGDLATLPRTIHRTDSPTRTIASFARDVTRVADGGEPVARDILAAAGDELAASAAAALGRVFAPGSPVAVSYAGSVFTAGATLREPFARRLAELWPTAELAEPAGDALAGAAELARGGASLPSEDAIALERS